jgi:hypothetical protein
VKLKSLILGEEQRLRTQYKGKHGYNKGWRKLHNEQLHICTFHCILLQCKIKNEMGRMCSIYGINEKWTQNFNQKILKGSDHLGDRHRWENNVKNNLKEIGCDDVEWIYSAQDRAKCGVLLSDCQLLKECSM